MEGEVDLAVAGQLEQALERAASQSEEVLIGLQACEFVDSTPIAMLVNARPSTRLFGDKLIRLAVQARLP